MSGCVKKHDKNIVTSHLVSSIELNKLILSNNISLQNIFYSDLNYALPTKEWVDTKFSLALFEFLTSFKSSEWMSEENDCDNFSSMSFSFAQILHHNTGYKLKNTSLAFGEFYYTKEESGEGHAINIFVVFTNNQYNILFYEPQLQKIITLSRLEKNNCLFLRF